MKVILTASVDFELVEALRRTGRISYHTNIALKRYFESVDRKEKKAQRPRSGNPQNINTGSEEYKSSNESNKRGTEMTTTGVDDK